jgi:hypothetical protein
MITAMFVLVLLALALLAPVFGVDSRSRSDDSWERDSLWSHLR